MIRATGFTLVSAAVLAASAFDAWGAAVEVVVPAGPGVVTTSISADPASGAIVTGPGTRPSRQHPSRIVVRLKRGASDGALSGLGAARRLAGDIFALDLPPGLTVSEGLRRSRALPSVLYAEPDYVLEAVALPNDTLYPQQWDMPKISAPEAWDTQTDAGDVVVAVIDTGIEFSHPDLSANMWTDPVSGAHGYSCLNGAVTEGGQDDNGHGTHVAGTIGAVTNNGLGVAGLNWNARILSLKFLGSGGSGQLSDAILCFQKAIDLKKQGVNIRVTNNSWGGGAFMQSLKDIMLSAEQAGILNVCAAGNSGAQADLAPMYPAAYDNRGIVSVMSTDSLDRRSFFSNFGRVSVDLAAPGTAILSTVPTTTCQLCDPTGYRTLSGTSMASPHVAGVAAALIDRHPTLSPEKARDVLLDTASYDTLTVSGSWPGRESESTTGGRLNFAKVIANPVAESPGLNSFPSVSGLPQEPQVVGYGQNIQYSPSFSDPDGDTGRFTYERVPDVSYDDSMLLGYLVRPPFPRSMNQTDPAFSIPAPSLARPMTVRYRLGASDQRGGGVSAAAASVSVTANPGVGGAPSGPFSVSPLSGPSGTQFTVSYSATDPEGQFTSCMMSLGHVAFMSSNSASMVRYCDWNLIVNDPPVLRVKAYAMDTELHLVESDSVVIRTGGAVGEPPIAQVNVSALSGAAPLTVMVDAGGSYDTDGSISDVWVYCGVTNEGQPGPTTDCIYNTPGVYRLWVVVSDNSQYTDSYWEYVTVLP